MLGINQLQGLIQKVIHSHCIQNLSQIIEVKDFGIWWLIILEVKNNIDCHIPCPVFARLQLLLCDSVIEME